MSAIATFRKRRGYDQRKLADMIGVHERTVSAWEVGRQFPAKKHLEALAKALGCKVSDLMGDM
jgi:transcriptional regulator with XRE-family HTH domain